MTDPGVAVFPPEINTGLVHGGAGPAPLEQAAMAFAAAAVQDEANAQQLIAILNAVRSQWEGQAAEQATSQLTPLIEWFQSLAVNGTATQAQIQLAASAIATAIAEAPVPPLVTENRTTWGVLNATNFFGVNTPAINVQDGHYLEMWFQAAFARATSDVETATATGALAPWSPPTVPVNPGMMGAPTAHAMTASFRLPAAGLDNLVKLANEASLDGLAAEGAAGDVAHTAETSRPNSALVASAADQRDGQLREAAQQNNPLDKASELGGQQAGQLGGQMSGIMSSVGQLPQAVQGAAQPLQQVASAPMQMGSQFGSMLQPLMSGSNFGAPALSGAESSMGTGMFATGGGPLAAALTKPASFAGGGGGGLMSSVGSGGSGLRLPASSLTAGANPASASGLGSTGTGATPAGSGMYGAPMHGQAGKNAAGGAENKYAAATRLGPQEVGDEMAS
ncbi:PPE domain-containing protein [Mycolicibacterium lutetiense]